jgi:hypothetical protein
VKWRSRDERRGERARDRDSALYCSAARLVGERGQRHGWQAGRGGRNRRCCLLLPACVHNRPDPFNFLLLRPSNDQTHTTTDFCACSNKINHTNATRRPGMYWNLLRAFSLLVFLSPPCCCAVQFSQMVTLGLITSTGRDVQAVMTDRPHKTASDDRGLSPTARVSPAIAADDRTQAGCVRGSHLKETAPTASCTHRHSLCIACMQACPNQPWTGCSQKGNLIGASSLDSAGMRLRKAGWRRTWEAIP